jgi:hypothetical protein
LFLLPLSLRAQRATGKAAILLLSEASALQEREGQLLEGERQ